MDLTPETGGTLRLAREDAGLSLSAMAARAHYTRGYLSNVETGKRAATAKVVLAYERVLKGNADRREILTGLTASVLAPAAVSELLFKGFAAAIGSGPSLDDWLERVEAYGRDYMSVGASELQPRLASDLVVLQGQLDTPARWAVASKLLALYAKTTPGTKNSSRWYNLAVHAADRSEDVSVRVWVRGRAALALAYEGAGLGTAGRLAEQAIAISDNPSVGRLNALTAKAHILAFKGDRSEAYKALDQAKSAFDIVGSDEQMSDYAVPEWRFHTFTSMLLSRIGDEHKAVESQEAADRTRPRELERFATHIEIHRGLMMARAGDVEGGATYARCAMAKLPVERHSLSLRLLLAEVERTERRPAR